MPAAESVSVEELILIPDKDRPSGRGHGATAGPGPFENAEGLLTLRRHGLAEQRRFTIEGGSTTLEIPLRENWIPNIQAHVVLVGSAERSGSGEDANSLPTARPAIAVGSHEFSLSTAQRVLDVEMNLGQQHSGAGANLPRSSCRCSMPMASQLRMPSSPLVGGR